MSNVKHASSQEDRSFQRSRTPDENRRGGVASFVRARGDSKRQEMEDFFSHIFHCSFCIVVFIYVVVFVCTVVFSRVAYSFVRIIFVRVALADLSSPTESPQ